MPKFGFVTFFAALLVTAAISTPARAISELKITDLNGTLLFNLTAADGENASGPFNGAPYGFFLQSQLDLTLVGPDGYNEWVAFNGILGNNTVRLRPITGSIGVPVSVGRDFTDITSSAKAQSSSANVLVYARVALDSVAAPEPMSVALLAVGAGLLATARRRRARTHAAAA